MSELLAVTTCGRDSAREDVVESVFNQPPAAGPSRILKGSRSMRIVTRPDFDGIVCAMLLRIAEGVGLPLVWAEPGDMQRGLVDVHSGDIVANPPLDVIKALSIAGGMNSFAKPNDIKILRRTPAGQKSIPFRYGDIEKGRNLEQNIRLQAGDVIVVP